MRQDTLEPPRLSIDRGAMLTRDRRRRLRLLRDQRSVARRAAGGARPRDALGREATSGKSVRALRSGDDAGAAGASTQARSGRERCAQRDPRSARRGVQGARRSTSGSSSATRRWSCVDEERLYFTNTGGELRQRFRFTVPHMRVTANEGDGHAVAQPRSRAAGRLRAASSARGSSAAARGWREEALQLLTAPNCPSGKMDLLLMPDQMMLQIHESIGHPLELDRILGDERNYAGTSFVTPEMFGNYRTARSCST